MSFVLIFFCLVETFGVLESLVLLIPEVQLIIPVGKTIITWFEEEQCVWLWLKNDFLLMKKQSSVMITYI